MKKKHLNLLVILMTIYFVSCEKEQEVEPTASFTMSKSSAEIDEVIIFTNTSQNATTFTWDFGDGNTSTNENPTHSFSDFGIYNIELIASGEGGIDIITKSIDIHNIVPGKRIGDFILGDNMESHFSKMESTSYFHIDIFYSDGRHVHLAYFDDIGIQFYIMNYSSTIFNSDVPYAISAYDPFNGKTEKGITIGSLLTEVEDAYGTPEEITSSGGYSYEESLGIEFWADDTESYVKKIYICEPSAHKITNTEILKSYDEEQLIKNSLKVIFDNINYEIKQ